MKAARNCVILKYKREDIDNVTMKNGIYLDPRWQDGYFTLRKATVLSVGDACKSLNEKYIGKEVVVNYAVSFDERHQEQIRRNGYFINMDIDRNIIRWANESDVYALIEGENLTPIGGRVFCEVINNVKEREAIGDIIKDDSGREMFSGKSGILIYKQEESVDDMKKRLDKMNEELKMYQKQMNMSFVPQHKEILEQVYLSVKKNIEDLSYQIHKITNKCYTTKVMFIHPDDSKELKVKKGDEIYCEPDSDVKIFLDDKEFLAVPSFMIAGIKK